MCLSREALFFHGGLLATTQAPCSKVGLFVILVQAVAGLCRSFLGEEGSVSTLTLLPVTSSNLGKGNEME